MSRLFLFNLTAPLNAYSTDILVSQQADGLTRAAYAKKAFETLYKIKNGDDNTEINRDQLKSDFIKAMPRLDADDTKNNQKKSELSRLIVGFLLDETLPLKHKADLKKEILQGKWPVKALNVKIYLDAKALNAKREISPHEAILMKTPMGAWEA